MKESFDVCLSGGVRSPPTSSATLLRGSNPEPPSESPFRCEEVVGGTPGNSNLLDLIKALQSTPKHGLTQDLNAPDGLPVLQSCSSPPAYFAPATAEEPPHSDVLQVVLPSCPCLGLHTPVPAQIAAQYPGLGYAPRDGPDTLISGLKKAASHYNEADPWRNLENEPVPFHLPHKHRGENVGTSEQINPLAGSVYSVNTLNPLLEYNEGCGLGLFGTRNELLQRYLAEKAQADNAAAQTLEAQKAALLPFLSERTERPPANAPRTGPTTEEQLNQQLLAEVLRAYTVSGTGKSVLDPCSLDAMQAPQPNMKRQNHKRKNITGILYKTELCRTWTITSSCRYGSKCQFAHGVDEQRVAPRHPKYKTELCRTYASLGACPYGERCRFIHRRPQREHDLQTVPDFLPWLASNTASSSVANACQPSYSRDTAAALGYTSASMMHGWLNDCLLSSKHLLSQDRGIVTFKTPGSSREAADTGPALPTTRYMGQASDSEPICSALIRALEATQGSAGSTMHY